jgi:uncharacterized protein (TIGR00661 family)
MVKIFYGICGEGMGHSGRSIALIERLTALGHSVTIFTFAHAFRLLTNSGYRPHAIHGLQFRERADGGVDVFGSLINFSHYLSSRRESLDRIRQLALAEQPDLCITDFEPLTALAAVSLGVPCYSVDNQHRFCEPLGREFPWFLRTYARLAGAFVRRWIKGPRERIVAVFHECPPSRYFVSINTLLRDRIANLRPTTGDHILLYGRGELGKRMARVASTVGERFTAYGCDPVDAPNIEFKATNYDEFAADLAACKAVLCSGGQQLIGEARYFGKPMLIVPIPQQHEQEINARIAQQEGIGEYCPIVQLSRERILAAYSRRSRALVRPANGVDQALELMGICNGRSDAQSGA